MAIQPRRKGDTYFVWRRSDGYVNASANRMPANWDKVTFEPLGEFDMWNEALERIIAARGPNGV